MKIRNWALIIPAEEFANANKRDSKRKQIMNNLTQIAQRRETIRMRFSFPLIFSVLALPATFVLGVAIGAFSPASSVVVAGTLIMMIILLLRLDELTAVLIVAVHILVDSYLGFDVYQVAMLMALVLLFVCYLGRSDSHPWTMPRSIWLWVLFLFLNIYPTINGSTFSLTNATASYFNLVLSTFIMFWLGNIITKDISALRRVFQLLSTLASVIAIHTIIEATTGKFLFETAYTQAILFKYSNFHIVGADVFRNGSFFGNPNGNGVFLATSFFLPLGLFIESKQLWAKMIYLLEMLLILIALLFTYSTGSWIAVLVGILIFLPLTGHIRYSLLLLLLMAVVAVVTFSVFHSQIATQLYRANNQSDLSLHLGSWQTAIRVIEAFPLFGVGLGSQAYLIRAEPLRVLAQTVPLAEPDNSYLQWGAIAGIPVMLVFLLLLGFIFQYSWHNWLAIDIRYRPLLGGGIIALIALSINSLVVNGWSDPGGVENLGFLIAGIVASPFIGQSTLSVDKTAETIHAQAEIEIG
jgi:O-antigen ligase